MSCRWLLLLASAVVIGVPSESLADLSDGEIKTPQPSPSPSPSPRPKAPDRQGLKDTKNPSTKPTPVKPRPKPGTKSPVAPKKAERVLAPSSRQTKKKKAEKEKTIKWSSHGLRGRRDLGKIELLDNVVVSQGSFRIESDYANINFNEERRDVSKVFARGRVKMTRRDDDTGERIRAFGDRMTFLNNERKVILEGNARLWRGEEVIRSPRLIYELDTGWIRAEKVEGELHPGKQAAKKGSR